MEDPNDTSYESLQYAPRTEAGDGSSRLNYANLNSKLGSQKRFRTLSNPTWQNGTRFVRSWSSQVVLGRCPGLLLSAAARSGAKHRAPSPYTPRCNSRTALAHNTHKRPQSCTYLQYLVLFAGRCSPHTHSSAYSSRLEWASMIRVSGFEHRCSQKKGQMSVGPKMCLRVRQNT